MLDCILPFFMLWIVQSNTRIETQGSLMIERRKFLQLALGTGILVPGILGTRQLLAGLPESNGDDEVFDGDEILARVREAATKGQWREDTFGAAVGAVGLALRGVPYSAGTLEGEREVCRVSLKGLDCVTFFESSLGIARIIWRNEELSSDALVDEVRRMRYRAGVVEGYTSRLHYYVDWVAENESNNVVKDISSSLPKAIVDERTINFMTEHSSAYPELKGNRKNIAAIRAVEEKINGLQRHWVPKRYIGETEKNLMTGDIVGITTSIAGLDVSHTGLCYRDDEGRLRLLHASLTKKKVLLDIDLDTYLAGNSKQTGIIVARPVAPERPEKE